jgi:hypothetical protein
MLNFTKRYDEPIWRITKFRITECSLVDNPANDMATISSVELAKRMDDTMISPETRKYLVSLGFDERGHFLDPSMRKKVEASNGPVNPATGTRSASEGDGDRTPAYQSELDLLAEFQRQFAIAITELGAENENGDLSPAEVLRQAIKVAAQRVINVTDLTGDDGRDPSLNPVPAQTREAQRRGEDGDFNQMFHPTNGFEIAKRLRCAVDDGGLTARLAKSDRVSVPGASSSLLRDEVEMRKFDDGSGPLDVSKVIREPEELAQRLAARNAGGLHKSLDFDLFTKGASSTEFEGSYSRGIGGEDAFDRAVIGIAKLHRRGGADDISKLLH